MRTFYLLVILLILCVSAQAQFFTEQNKVWAFGNHAGVDFNSGAPVSFTSSINTMEGCAAISDDTGGLLFYTDGKMVYNRMGLVMPGGSSIAPFSTNSSSQGTVVIPVYGNHRQYYIFSLQEGTYSPPSPGSLTYVIVDMTLDAGMGDVLSSGGYLGDRVYAEKMIAIPGDDCSTWLVLHRNDTSKFIAYEITLAGIGAPVISSVGKFRGPGSYSIGVMKASPDGSMIVNQVGGIDTANGTELLDFDRATGIVSNCRVLDSTHFNYGAEFSPGMTKLYVNEVTTGTYMAQYDLTLPTLDGIRASKQIIASGGTGFVADLKLAPDGKIYFVNLVEARYLARIDQPDMAGAACDYTPYGIDLSPNTGYLGLPNVYTGLGISPILGPSTVCLSDTALVYHFVAGGVWSSSNPSVAAIGTGTGKVAGVSLGTATLTYDVSNGCGAFTITKLITVTNQPNAGAVSGIDTICEGDTVTYHSTIVGGMWTSIDTAKAKIDTFSGSLIAGGAGLDTIRYMVSNSCGTDTAVKRVYIYSAAACPTSVHAATHPAAPVVRIYPQPNNGRFVILLSVPAKEQVSVTITDMMGQKVRELTAPPNGPIPLSLDVPAGIYLLTAATATGRWNEKIIVR